MNNQGTNNTLPAPQLLRGVRIIGLAALLLFALGLGWAAAEEQDYRQFRDPVKLEKLIESGGTPHIVVDVRTSGEYQGGHIPTAVNIPVQVIANKPPEVPKDRVVIVYCRSGNRSAAAAEILRENGYSRVVDFGGIYRWNGELEE